MARSEEKATRKARRKKGRRRLRRVVILGAAIGAAYAYRERKLDAAPQPSWDTETT